MSRLFLDMSPRACISSKQSVKYIKSHNVKYLKLHHKPLKDPPLTISEFHKCIFGILSQRFHPISGTAKVGPTRIHNW